jgi:hypothetical protein
LECYSDFDCDDVGGDGVCEPNPNQDRSITVTENIHVTDSVPASLEGTVAAVVVTVKYQEERDDKESHKNLACRFNVVP